MHIHYRVLFMVIDEKFIYAGLVLCLLWNVIAVTAAWIKGEGEFKYIKEGLIGLFNRSNYKSNISKSHACGTRPCLL